MVAGGLLRLPRVDQRPVEAAAGFVPEHDGQQLGGEAVGIVFGGAGRHADGVFERRGRPHDPLRRRGGGGRPRSPPGRGRPRRPVAAVPPRGRDEAREIDRAGRRQHDVVGGVSAAVVVAHRLHRKGLDRPDRAQHAASEGMPARAALDSCCITSADFARAFTRSSSAGSIVPGSRAISARMTSSVSCARAAVVPE